jgi:hypothetical protein
VFHSFPQLQDHRSSLRGDQPKIRALQGVRRRRPRNLKYSWKEQSGSTLIFGEIRVAGKTFVLPQHITDKEPENPRPKHNKWNPVHLHDRTRKIDEDFAEVIRVARSREESVFNQSLPLAQCKKPLASLT